MVCSGLLWWIVAEKALSGSGVYLWKVKLRDFKCNAEVGVGIWDVSYRKYIIALRSTYVAITSNFDKTGKWFYFSPFILLFF